MLASTITLLEALVLIGTVLWITQYSISRRAHAYERPSSVNQQINQLPKVSIIIPAYREKRQSIEKTLDSLSSQNYPRNLMEVLVVVDRDDVHTLNETLKAVETFLNSLNIKVIINENAGRRLKAIAINNAMKHVSGSIVGIYDADDVFPRDQVLNAVLLMMEKNYAAVGTRVYRFRNTVLGSLMYLESLVWYNAIVPFLRTTVKITPLSGEGLFIRRDVVTSIPESLAEDALLSLELSRRGYGIGLLDSYVYELAPFKEATERVKREGLEGRVEIVHGDFFRVPIKEATVVYMYLLTSVNEALKPKLKQELRPGTRVVTLDFQIPGWKPVRVVGDRSGWQRTLYVYVIGDSDS